MIFAAIIFQGDMKGLKENICCPRLKYDKFQTLIQEKNKKIRKESFRFFPFEKLTTVLLWIKRYWQLICKTLG